MPFTLWIWVGADKVFNHREANSIQEILEYTSGIDVILEMAADINLGKDLTLLSPGRSTQ